MSTSSTTTESTSNNTWLMTYTKLKFFARIRRFLKLKASKKQYELSDQVEEAEKSDILVNKREEENMGIKRSDDHNQDQDGWMVLQKNVKRLLFGSWEEKEMAAREIRVIAKEDLRRRKSMAELGIIPPLVAMVGSPVVERQRFAVQALIELADGSFTNKGIMVEAGILSNLPEKMESFEEQLRKEFTELLLSLSTLSTSQFSDNLSRMIPFAAQILESSSSIETKCSCLVTLYNLSSVLENAAIMVSTGLVNSLMRLSPMKELSEKALVILANLVVTVMGKKALEENEMIPESLIEIMTWEDEQKCQELSVYVLMILAHQSSVQRKKMAKAGIVPVLLEVALLSSPLAQKRALKLLQWFKDERQTKMGPHSGPQVGRLPNNIGSPVHQEEVDQGRKMMKKIVKQSLYKNLETITRRANGDEDSSKLKALVISSSSKSLPY